MMANWVLAWHHSRGGIFHVCATWRKTRCNNLRSQPHRLENGLSFARRAAVCEFKDSMAFVV